MKNWKKLIAVAMAGAMSMSMLAACGSSSDSSAASSAPAAASSAAASSTSVEKKDGDVKIAYIVKAKTDEFWTTMETGAYAAAEEKGVTLEFQAPEKETDVEKQVQMVENAVVKGFDAIILSAADSTSLLPSIVKANNAGIPVVLVNDT
ncbi:MAG: substrate-binding domain-containing protein, partial [Eubacterium sp.]|nr:substrate-binding domain-containing protein [Eubacterium sp.]